MSEGSVPGGLSDKGDINGTNNARYEIVVTTKNNDLQAVAITGETLLSGHLWGNRRWPLNRSGRFSRGLCILNIF